MSSDIILEDDTLILKATKEVLVDGELKVENILVYVPPYQPPPIPGSTGHFTVAPGHYESLVDKIKQLEKRLADLEKKLK